MKRLARLTLAGAVLVAAVPAWAGEVKVSFSSGLVTVVATEATPRQILTEWARQGHVQITNLDRLSGGPLTLQMVDVPEAQALETVLRGTAGYVAAPRAEALAAGSGYDRILLMPGAAPVVAAPGAASAPTTNMSPGRGRPAGPPGFDTDPGDNSESPWSRTAMGQGPRDAATPDAYRQAGPGQIVMPGVMPQPPSYYPTSPNAQAPGSGQQMRDAQQRSSPSAVNQQGSSSAGATTPGVFTSQPQPQRIPTTPYSNGGGTALPITSSPVPGQVVGQPLQPDGASMSTARPAGSTSPSTFQNPYGLAEPMRPPVVNPNANPYGLPAPVKTTTPTTPPAPIKKSGTGGGQG